MSAAKTTAFDRVPIVDVSGLQSFNKADRQAVATQLAHVASNVGFLYALGHGVSEEAIHGIQDAAKDFFALSESERMQVYIGSNPGSNVAHKGYVPEGEEVFDLNKKADHKSAFDIGMEFPGWEDDPLVRAKTPMLGFNQWPQQLGAEFRAKVVRYYDECFAFGMRLWRGFALALGLEEAALDGMVTFPPTNLRMVHYPYTPDDPATHDAPGIGAHTDYEYFTMLLPTAPGLEVLNGAGQWIDVPPIPGAYVVNISDLLEVMTAGKMVATTHRVRPVQQERYSFPMFFAINYHELVRPLPELLPPGHEEQDPNQQPVRLGDHIWSAVAKSHRYGLRGIESGEIVLPEDAGRLYGRQEVVEA